MELGRIDSNIQDNPVQGTHQVAYVGALPRKDEIFCLMDYCSRLMKAVIPVGDIPPGVLESYYALITKHKQVKLTASLASHYSGRGFGMCC